MSGATPRAKLADLGAPPNLLSLLRLALVPVALALLASGNRVGAVVVLAAMAVTDGLDGYVARATGRVTELGKVLDPLADKVAVDSVLLLLAVRGEFPWWVAGLVVGRDLAIAGAALAIARRLGGVPPSNAFGKATFVVLAATAIAYAADVSAVEGPLLVLVVGFVVISSVSYARDAARALGSARGEHGAGER